MRGGDQKQRPRPADGHPPAQRRRTAAAVGHAAVGATASSKGTGSAKGKAPSLGCHSRHPQGEEAELEGLLLHPETFGAGDTAIHLGAQEPGRPLLPDQQRHPFALLRGGLSPQLLAFLAGDGSVQHLVAAGTEDCSPDAHYRGHKAVTYHAVGDDASCRIDLTGFDHDGPHPPAGPRLFAFARAFRMANRRGLEALEARLRGAGFLLAPAVTRPERSGQPAAGADGAQLLEDFQSRVFGSVTVQHFVPPTADVARPDGLALDYHTDSGASALHLGVSIAGERRLRLRRAARGAVVEEEIVLRAGDVYLSSPCAFAHAVHRGGAAEPPEASAHAVAIQFRIAVPAAALAVLDCPGKRMSGGLLRCIAEALGDATPGLRFRLPDLEEVRACLEPGC